MIKNYKDMDVWKKSIALVKEVYLITKKFPREEIYGLTAQMRRAAVSIPSNIAEGKARQTGKEFLRFLYIALGSAGELETQIIISRELDYIDSQTEKNLLDKLYIIVKMLQKLANTLRT